MITIHGGAKETKTRQMKNKVIIGDADALIALAFDKDSLHNQAIIISEKLFKNDSQVIFPDTAISEAITTLLRKHSNPELAVYLAQQYKKGIFRIEYINEELMKLAVDFFIPTGSKQNTFFDAIVASTAKYLAADAIFSFDGWYKKLGFQLAADL